VSAACPLRATGLSRLVMDITKYGVWFFFDGMTAARSAEFARTVEKHRYGALWIPEAIGREPFAHAAYLASQTERLVFATGIANIYARDPVTMAAGHKTLSEAYPGRFVLGLGVSHVPLVEELRGHRYENPITAMRTYLDAMDQAPYRSVLPSARPVRMLAALGPQMLQLAAQRTDGAHPYNVTPEHTARAREILGAGGLLCPEQAVVLEKDPAKARPIARAFLSIYLGLPNYTNNFLRLGFREEDCQNGGSDRLVDAIIAWGDLEAIRSRIRAHHAAGADHVCIQVLPQDPRALPMAEWRELAAALET
jgi:probable F420-dependent oxidoreductase